LFFNHRLAKEKQDSENAARKMPPRVITIEEEEADKRVLFVAKMRACKNKSEIVKVLAEVSVVCDLELAHVTATHCNTLLHTATHCNTHVDTSAIVKVLSEMSTHALRSGVCDFDMFDSNTPQHAATRCNTVQYTATHRNKYVDKGEIRSTNALGSWV